MFTRVPAVLLFCNSKKMKEKIKQQIHYALWEVTQQCNLNCIHCRANSSPTKEDARKIIGQDVKRLIDELS